jgi:hypothetical protein
LERFFFLDDDDRDLIALRRSDAHRLGIAVQVCTVRYIGRFLGEDPLAVPWEVVEYLAGQLGIEDSSCVKRVPRAQVDGVRARCGDPEAIQVPGLQRPQVGAGVPKWSDSLVRRG